MDPYAKIAELEGQLIAARQEIQKLRHDTVSGLLGRQAFEDTLEAIFSLRREDDGQIGVIMCDIDHFKKVNDEHGHRVGDEVLSHVAQTIRACVRSSDLVARYGGEEFVCVLARTDMAGLSILAERIRQRVEDLDQPGCPRVTISVGFSMQRSDDSNGWDIVKRADAALYQAKELGRNRVESDALGYEEIQLIDRIEELRREENA